MAYDWHSYCGDSIWDSQLIWNTSQPRLTACFRKTILVWCGPVYLTLFIPLLIWSLIQSKQQFQWNRYNGCRMVLAVLLLADLFIQLTTVLYNYTTTGFLNNTDRLFPADVVNAFIYLTFALIQCIIFWFMMKRGLHTSGIVWSYLLICSACQLIELIFTMFIMDGQIRHWNIYTITWLINILITFGLFIQSFFADSKFYKTNNNDQRPNAEKLHPKMMASFFSRLNYIWYSSLTYIGFKREIIIDDVWRVMEHDSSHYNNKLFMSEFEQLKMTDYRRQPDPKKPQPNFAAKFNVNIIKIISKTLPRYFLVGSFFKIFNDILIFVNPMIMKLLIHFVDNSEEPTWHGYIFAFGLFIATIGQIYSLNYYFERMMIFGMRVRTQLIGAIYRKSLKISNSSRSKFTTGQIVNMMAVDAQRFMDISQFINMLWSAPLQILVSVWLLWNELGIAVLGGLLFMILLIPVNIYITNISKKLQIKLMKIKDERVKAMNEILNGIKIIKLYGWEQAFINNIKTTRSNELKMLKKINYIEALLMAIWNVAPMLVSFITFALYVLLDSNHVLTPARAFVSLALFNILRFPLVMLPSLVTLIIMTSVSVKRLNKFLGSAELTNYIGRNTNGQQYCIMLDNCSFSWRNRYENSNNTSNDDDDEETGNKNQSSSIANKVLDKNCIRNSTKLEQEKRTEEEEEEENWEKNDQSKPFLREISIRIKEKSFVAIVGNVGSGKSSLLNAILGNMELIQGSINITGSASIAYTSQEAWIQNNTLKENIIFNRPFNEKLYEKVVHACSLVQDFSILPGGDMTEIGEKGINLSGGQKQRVSLARACYNNADIYLLDDPLSAVDSHVGKHIFENILSSETGLLKEKTRILVTNNLSILPYTDLIIVLKKGRIIETGTYQHLMAEKKFFANLIEQYSNNNNNNNDNDNDNDDNDNGNKKNINDVVDIDDKNKTDNGEVKKRRRTTTTSNMNGETGQKVDKLATNFKINKLIEKEVAQTGQVKRQVYGRYLKAISGVWCLAIIINYVLSQASHASSGVWLSYWSANALNNIDHSNHHSTIFYLLIYGLLGALVGLFQAFGWLSMTKGVIGAALKLHDKMLHTILRSPMNFFDITPLGRILNRFSKDIDVCDSSISSNFRVFVSCLLSTLATLLIISVQLPIFLIIILPVVLCFYLIQKLYISTARQLKRIESITKSPIYSHFSETLSGVNTIRAYDVCNQFTEKNDHNVDMNNSCNIAIIIANRWLGIRLALIANFIVLFAALFAVIYREKIDSSTIGLVITFALTITQNLNFLVRSSADVETNIVSVERILEYTDLSLEADWIVEGNSPPKNWPSMGRVEFIDYATRYRKGLDLVLKGITATIEPCEKIGIVGRTGAGKSSLTLALFRLIEPANGCIRIDGIDIFQLGLHQLRKCLTIIPQDPILFSGTIRSNLDPFNDFSDESLWRCLELAHLKEFVRSLDKNLEYEINEGGSNLSVGQRQLICLARALLRKTKILILDEATAAVDMETDSLIQHTIKQSFNDCTILTIAHRLNTVMDSDRILVLDDGHIAEFDSPANLLANENTIFYSMVQSSGLLAENNENSNSK